jgi:uncharacterized cupredoxin-like copper-binding protein
MIKNIPLIFFLFSSLVFAQLLQPRLVMQQTTHDFGDIKQGETVSHTFVLSNNGGDLLKITNVQAACGCTAAIPEKNEIAPGESTNLPVKFNSAGRMGKQVKTVKVFTNDPQTPEITISISCNIVKGDQSGGLPTIYFPETQHDFGKVSEGEKINYTFKFINQGQSDLEIKDVKSSCGCTAALISSSNIKPGQEGTIKVEFDTKNRSGKNSKTVTVQSNDPKDPTKILTIYADIIKKGG